MVCSKAILCLASVVCSVPRRGVAEMARSVLMKRGVGRHQKKIGKFYTRHPVFCKFTWASDVQTSSVAEFVGMGCLQRFDKIMPT